MTENKGGLWGGGGEEGAQEARIGSNIRSIMDRKEQYVISMRTYGRNSKAGIEEDFFCQRMGLHRGAASRRRKAGTGCLLNLAPTTLHKTLIHEEKRNGRN